MEWPSTTVYATTSYSYDARGNLKQVNQSTQTPRTFSYDGLSRLTTATNPESGSVSYTYDLNSNLKTKQDARNITTTYSYDELNRVTLRDYSDTTADVSYVYDPAIANGKGRLASVTSSVSSYNYTAFDALGRVTQYNQQTASQLYTMSATYNKGGLMLSETYPSQKVIETQYDGAGRIAGVKKQSLSTFIAGAASSDATNRMQYTAHGGVSAMKLGNGLWEHVNFNSRLQPTQIGLGVSSTTSERLQLDYGYGASASLNNGNITSQQITAPGFSVTQNYSYDQVNRLASATETAASVQTWQQVYGYDVYGNRWVNASSYIPTPALTPQSQSAFSAANNRLTTALGFNYDAVGNVTKDPTTAAGAMVYDAENRQTSYTKAAVTTSYSYDGDGRRVKKVDSTGTTVFVYNAAGQLVAEYTDAATSGTATMSYLTTDHLGSTRVVTDGTGAVKARHDYLPFGEEIGSGKGGRASVTGYAAVDSTRQRFTSKERDTESGLDYFLARYYSSAQGRFTSPDPIPITPERQLDPQAINLYQYVRNNPLAYLDPTGMELVRLGQHTDEQINNRVGEIDAEVSRIISEEQGEEAQKRIDSLLGERNTLLIEQEGNRVVGQLLKELNAIGEGKGLQLSDFTLSTDPKNDYKPLVKKRGFKGKALEKEVADSAAAVAVVFRGDSKQIFINQTNMYYQAVREGYGLTYPGYGTIQPKDVAIITATYLSHEKFHRDRSSSERLAYKEQLRVLNKFPGAFVNQKTFTDFQRVFTNGSKTGVPTGLYK